MPTRGFRMSYEWMKKPKISRTAEIRNRPFSRKMLFRGPGEGGGGSPWDRAAWAFFKVR